MTTDDHALAETLAIAAAQHLLGLRESPELNAHRADDAVLSEHGAAGPSSDSSVHLRLTSHNQAGKGSAELRGSTR